MFVRNQAFFVLLELWSCQWPSASSTKQGFVSEMPRFMTTVVSLTAWLSSKDDNISTEILEVIFKSVSAGLALDPEESKVCCFNECPSLRILLWFRVARTAFTYTWPMMLINVVFAFFQGETYPLLQPVGHHCMPGCLTQHTLGSKSVIRVHRGQDTNCNKDNQCRKTKVE